MFATWCMECAWTAVQCCHMCGERSKEVIAIQMWYCENEECEVCINDERSRCVGCERWFCRGCVSRFPGTSIVACSLCLLAYQRLSRAREAQCCAVCSLAREHTDAVLSLACQQLVGERG